VTPLTIFGLFAVTAMLICYALESRSRWFILAFAVACVLGSVYGFLQGAWPFRIGRGGLVWSGDTPVGFSGTLKVIPCRLANYAGLAEILPTFWDRCCHR